MNGVMCLLLPDSPTQIMIGMVITFLFMTITLQQRPYKCSSDHNLSFACHMQLFITLLGGFVTREEIPFLGSMDVDNTIGPEFVGLIVVLSHAAVCTYGFFAIILERYFSDEQQRLRRATRKKVLKKANRGFAVARQLAKEQVEMNKQIGSRGLANNLAKKMKEDKARKKRLGGFGVHSLVKGDHHSTLDKALGKFEKKTKVAPVRGVEKHDFSTAGRALNWSAKGGLGNKLSLAAGKALVEKKKVIVKPPPGGKHHHHHKHKDKHSSDDETGSDYSGSSYETDSSDSESSGSSSGSESS